MRRQAGQWLIPILLAAGAAGALWYYWITISAEAPPAPEPVAAEPVNEPEELPQRQFPLPEPLEADRPDLVPLPALDESDEYFKIELMELFGTGIEARLADSRLIERFVATVDNLPRSHVAERIRPVGRLDDEFLVTGQDGSGAYAIDPSNYRRYEPLIAIATNADPDALVELYRRYYPLLQSSYVELGYPDGYFNDRLVEVIDHLLETPGASSPVALTRPHVLYEYEDADLEARSAGQKLLLRMGADNAEALKVQLRAFRTRIVNE